MTPRPLPQDLSGAIDAVTGTLSWTARMTVSGRTWVTVRAVAPTGQKVVMSVRFPDAYSAAAHLPGTIEHFQRSTLAQWEEQTTPVRLLVVLTEKFDVTVGRHGHGWPQVLIERRDGSAVKGWDRCYLRTRGYARTLAPHTPDMA